MDPLAYVCSPPSRRRTRAPQWVGRRIIATTIFGSLASSWALVVAAAVGDVAVCFRSLKQSAESATCSLNHSRLNHSTPPSRSTLVELVRAPAPSGSAAIRVATCHHFDASSAATLAGRSPSPATRSSGRNRLELGKREPLATLLGPPFGLLSRPDASRRRLCRRLKWQAARFGASSAPTGCSQWPPASLG